MTEGEQSLAGGNVSGVVRIGDRIHRQVDAWSPAVHDLLKYLETQGFDGAPRFLGLDSQGREMLTFVEGEVGNDPVKPYMRSDESLVVMARMLRRFHDLTAGCISLLNRTDWQLIYPDKNRHEVICHNDAAPYNTVFVNGEPVALIDFDTAGPGPRIWDVAYSLYTFIPLSRFAPDAEGEVGPYASEKHAESRRRRIALFCDSYGLEDREQLPAAVDRRLMALHALIQEKAALGSVAFLKMVDEGHLAYYQAEIEFHRRHFHEYF